MRIRISELRDNPDWHQTMLHGKVSGDGVWLILPDGANPLDDQWPIWAKTLATRRKDADRGVGDTAERVFGTFGGQAFKAAFKALTGHDCGCCARREQWNALFPYRSNAATL